MQPVIINADDFAMDADGDAAIAALAARGAVTSTSAMVLSPRWPEASRRLADLPLDAGLHLDLTSPFARDVFDVRPLWRLTVAAHAKRLDRARLKLAIDRQLENFGKVLKAKPVFVDGHHHAHHLPVVREALVEALALHYGPDASRIHLRICTARRWRGLKAEIIRRTGSEGLEKAARAAGHPINSDFAGVYSFSGKADLSALWRDWTADLEGEAPLIMCHVALPGDAQSAGDTIRGARIREYRWLSSGSFFDLCQSHSRRPERWPRV